MMKKITDQRIESINVVLKKCFWGEYNLTAQEILSRLDKKDKLFSKFLFSKIIESSSHPSRHIKNIFAPQILKPLLEEYLKKGKEKKRFSLISVNLTGDYDNVPEYQWRR